MNCLLLGLDLGTSACKVGILSTAGDPLALTSQPYALSTPAPAWVEQNPVDWWQAVTRAIRESLGIAGIDPHRIKGVSIAGQTPGLVLLDKGGNLLRPAIIWQDRRASNEANDILSRIPLDDLTDYLGTAPSGDLLTTPSRLLWLKKHEPEILRQAAVLLQPKDYVNFRLTGEYATDFSSALGLADLQSETYHARYFDVLGLPSCLAAPLVTPTSVVGRVGSGAAAETGLMAGTPVVAGTIDAMTCVFGCDVLEPGVAFEVAGTSEVTGLTVEKPIEISGLMSIPLLGGAFMLGGPMQAGGQAVEWFLRAFPPPEKIAPYEQLNREAACAPAGANGLVFLPYLAGERTPIWDSRARGVFIGITTQHTWGDFARAVLEGVAYAVAQVLDLAEAGCGESADELRICGGPARNTLWNQIKADVTGKNVRPMRVPEAGVVGAAMLAGIGVGIFASYADAADAMAHVAPVIFGPDMERHQRYAAFLTFHRNLYSELETSFETLAELCRSVASSAKEGQQ